jgi:hypothetical protein
VLLAACTRPQPPRIEHHAAPQTDETFVLDAPLFSSDPTDEVLWTLERHGHAATLTIAGEAATGTFDETGGKITIEVAGAQGAITLDCERRAAQVHVAAAAPEARGEHAVCSVKRAWHPADVVTVATLACLVHRDELRTQITMAPPPGLQAVVDDCCDDADNCERRWDIRLRSR